MKRLVCAFSLVILSGCGGDEDVDSDSRDSCTSECSQLNGGGRSNCVAPTEMAACRDACFSEAPNSVESFNSCVNTNRKAGGLITDDGSDRTCPERACLDILSVEYAGETE